MNSYPQKPVVARPKTVSQGGCFVNRLLGAMLLLLCAVGFSFKTTAADWTRQNDGNAAITAESCVPANGFIDPGETNTVSFVLKNTSGGDRTEVKVTILETGGVSFPSGEVNVGSVARDATFTVSFSLRANGSCATSLTPTLRVTSKDRTAENVVFNAFQLGATTKTNYTASNTSAITINDFNTDSARLGRATPYPSSITVSGVPKADTGETVDRVTVTLNNISHGYSQDIQVLLVAPNGTRVPLMGDAGGAQAGVTAPITDVSVTFDEAAAARIPANAGAIISGTYRTSDYNPTPYPFPNSGAGNATSLTALNNMADPNGAWRLYVVDESTGDQGIVAGGWNLNIRTTKIVCCGAGQLWPFVTRIQQREVDEDLGGAKDVVIAGFSAWDLDDADASRLTMSATSSDQSKVTNDNLVVDGSSVVDGVAERTVRVKQLVPNASGDVTITVVVTDPQGHTSTSSFTLRINPKNDTPTISSILGQKVTTGTATGPIAFTVSDVETLPDNLIFEVSSNNEAAVPRSNIIVSGSGANRTVNVIPASPLTAEVAAITITVRDLGQPGDSSGPRQASTTFIVDFRATAGVPTITPYVDANNIPAIRAVDEDASITIPFQVRSGNPNISPESLILTRQSSNEAIVPTANIVFGGSGTDRTITVTPAANQNGTVIITLVVSNGAQQDSTRIQLNVNPVNDAPTITTVGPQITNEDTVSGDIVFTLGDWETDKGVLTVTVTSDNTALIPTNEPTTEPPAGGGYSVTGAEGVRTLRIRPAPNVFGKANVTVSVTDRGDPDGTSQTNDKQRPRTTSTSFVFTVNPVNDPPVVTAVRNATGDTTEQPWVGNTDPTIAFPEDSGSTADDTKGQRTIVLLGVAPGPLSPPAASEAGQSVSIQATSSRPDVLSVVRVEFTNGEWRLIVRLGENRSAPADNPVEITLTLQDNGGTALGGNDTAVRKFKVVVAPINDPPIFTLPTLPPVRPGAPEGLQQLDVSKNRSFTLPMNVSDAETPKTLIQMTASVDHDFLNVFPTGSILFDPARTIVTFIPARTLTAEQLPYTVKVTLTATDNGATNTGDDRASTSRSFWVSIKDIEPPTVTVSPGTDIQVDEDTVATPFLTLADNDPVSEITFTVRSDNEALIPSDNVLFGPLDGNRRAVAIVPVSDQNGVANITITARDAEGLETQVALKVTVRPVSDPPRLTMVASIAPTIDAGGNPVPRTITINEDTATKDDADAATNKLLSFDIADAPNETPSGNLVITKDSSNRTLIPLDNIVIAGTGTRRTVTVTPVANKNSGTDPVVISLTVTDESGLTSTGTFRLIVASVNDAPTVASINKITLQETTTPSAQTVTLTGLSAGPDPGDVITPEEDSLHGQIDSITVTVKDKGSDPAVNNLIAGITPVTNVADGRATFTFTQRPNVSGTATFTVTVRDRGDTLRDGKNSTSTSFDVEITRNNAQPSISFDQTTQTLTVSRTLSLGQTTQVIQFFVSDIETPATTLQVTAVSSNPNLVPNTPANIQLGGSGNTRGILVTPAPGQFGTSAITITVRDADGSTRTATLNVTVTPGIAPGITLTPSSQQIQVNNFSDLIQITLTDAQGLTGVRFGYDEAGLVTSDNPALVPASPTNIQFGGTGANRVMIILPNQNQTGTANITLRAKDAEGNLSDAVVFTLRVLGSAPTISAPTPALVNVDLGRQSAPVTVTVGDKETFPALLTVTGRSSDQTVIPDTSIFVLGSNTSRSVSVLAGSKGGSATITLTVADAEGQTATTSFVVNVADTNTNPTITSIGAQSTAVNRPTGVINFVVGDNESFPALLTVEATSANTTLVPNSSANILVLTSPGNPASRSLVITPAADQSGTALITVKVTDPGGRTAETSFALTVSSTTVANDFNGDGTQDIILQDNGGFLAAWFMSGDDVLSTSFFTPNNVGDASWKAVGSGDFNGDGRSDILFQHTDGFLAVWTLSGVTLQSVAVLSPSGPGSADWRAVATADFNKDADVDILFQHTDGTLAVWFMDGTTLASVAELRPRNAGAGWGVVGAGDINGDTNVDIVFQHTDGTLAVWYLTGNTNLLLPSLLTPQHPGDANWRAIGTIDLNGDGRTDLLFQNRADSSIAIWYMNRASLILGKLINPSNPGGTWRVVAP